VSADEDGERRTRWIPLAFSVFHVGQVEPNVVRYSGRIRTVRHASSRDLVLAKYAPAPLAPLERDEKAEKVLTAVGADVRHGGDSAYYNRRTDHVQLPEPGQFHDAIAYFGTWAHELGHWTGNAERTNRHALPNHLMPGTPDEELVAELSATFTCQHLGIEPTPRDDHAHYVASWLTALKNDNRALYRAAKLAEQATAYLMEAAGVDMSDPEPMIEHEDAA
jgi:antirestriction protein ArdC